MSNTGPLVTGLFPDRNSAEAAYTAAEARGYTADEMNLAMSDDTRKTHFTGTTAGKDDLPSINRTSHISEKSVTRENDGHANQANTAKSRSLDF